MRLSQHLPIDPTIVCYRTEDRHEEWQSSVFIEA